MFHAKDSPESWSCVPLGDRIELEYGAALKVEDRVTGTIPVYGSNGPVGTHNRSLVKGPGILVGRKGSIGAVHVASSDYWPIDTVYYVRQKADDEPAYLAALLQFMDLAKLNAATGVPGLSRRDALALRGMFPPPTEQAAIARILDAADAAIARTRTAIEKARRVKKALLQRLLTVGAPDPRESGREFVTSRFGRFPKAWAIERLDAVAEVGSGVTLGKDTTGFKAVDLPYLRVANVQDGHLNLDEIKTVRVRADEAHRYLLQSGDVVMTEGGDIDKLGRGTIWPGTISPCLHQNHIFRVRTDRDRLLPEYLAAVIGSEFGKRYFMRIAKRTTNLASINKTQLRAFTLPVPDVNEQTRVIAILKAADRQIEAAGNAHESMVRAKRGLLQDLLTGRIRVTAGKPKSVTNRLEMFALTGNAS